jgi:hypothetical protein
MFSLHLLSSRLQQRRVSNTFYGQAVTAAVTASLSESAPGWRSRRAMDQISSTPSSSRPGRPVISVSAAQSRPPGNGRTRRPGPDSASPSRPTADSQKRQARTSSRRRPAQPPLTHGSGPHGPAGSAPASDGPARPRADRAVSRVRAWHWQPAASAKGRGCHGGGLLSAKLEEARRVPVRLRPPPTRSSGFRQCCRRPGSGRGARRPGPRI